MTVPDEAVEAAARGMFAEEQCDRRQKLDVESNWMARLDDRDRDEYRGLARAAIEAAAPFIAAQALADAISYAEDRAMAGAHFPDWQNCADKIRTIPNPYRSEQ